MISNRDLWAKIEAFSVDAPGTRFSFVERLAHENGWSKAFAEGAFTEYKRFVYLARVSGAEVTPSDIVDQVWHLHLTFTRSYWSDLCDAVLERPLHHNPTKGGKAEITRFREQYAATLALYRAEFGGDAPAAFWPAANARFSSFAHQAWVDRRTHWVIAKPTWRAWLAGAGATMAATGTAAAADGNDDTIAAIVIGGVLAAGALIFAAVASGAKGKRRRSSRNDDGSAAAIIPATTGSGSKKSDGGEGGEGGEGGDGGGGDGGGGCGGGGGGCGGGGSG
jgi:hypothetical protein